MDKPRRAPVLEITNKTTSAFHVSIEMYPTDYLLGSGETMKIAADLEGHPISMIVSDDTITLYAGNDCEPDVTIDGAIAKPSWEVSTLTNVGSSRKARGFTAALGRLFRLTRTHTEE